MVKNVRFSCGWGTGVAPAAVRALWRYCRQHRGAGQHVAAWWQAWRSSASESVLKVCKHQVPVSNHGQRACAGRQPGHARESQTAHLDMVQFVSCNLAKDVVCLLGVVAACAALCDHCGGAGHAGRQGGASGGAAVEGSLQVLQLEGKLDCRQAKAAGVSSRAGA